MLGWDSYRAHLTLSVKGLFRKGKVVQAIIPGGEIGHIQPLAGSWNASLKEKLCDFYDSWMDEGPHTYTKAGNMRAPLLKTILQWVFDACRELVRYIIV